MKAIDKYKYILNEITNISSMEGLSESDFLKKIYEVANNIIEDFDYSMLFYYQNDKFKVLSTEGYDKYKINQLNIKKEKVLNTFKNNKIYQFNEKKLYELKSEGKKYKELLFFEIKTNKLNSGGIIFEIKEGSNLAFNKENLDLLENFKVVINNYYEKKQIKKQQLLKTVEVLTGVLDTHDNYTNGHSIEVAKLAKSIGTELSLKEEDLDNLYLIGLLHDIGKTFIKKEILNKPGKLLKSEFEIIKQHPMKGATLLNNFKEVRAIRKNILHHHEKWDGSGYPSGLEKEEIPFLSTIISVADAFNAMTSKRPYKKPMSTKEAIEEIKRCSGTQFNPKVVNAFVNLMKKKYKRTSQKKITYLYRAN